MKINKGIKKRPLKVLLYGTEGTVYKVKAAGYCEQPTAGMKTMVAKMFSCILQHEERNVANEMVKKFGV